MCAFQRPSFIARIRVSISGSVNPAGAGCAPAIAVDATTTQSSRALAENLIGMEFNLLDRYLLEGAPAKEQVVEEVLAAPRAAPGAAPFYEGIRMLGAKTPDLTLIALRLVLAGKPADDAHVVRLRDLMQRARAKGEDAQSAVEAYRRELA